MFLVNLSIKICFEIDYGIKKKILRAFLFHSSIYSFIHSSTQLSLREVVTITSTSDLSGTMVTGSDTILVQSGSNKAAAQGETKGQLMETLPPLSNQGTLHFGVPTTGRSSDVYRLVCE